MCRIPRPLSYYFRFLRLCISLRFLRPIFLRPDFFNFGLLRPIYLPVL